MPAELEQLDQATIEVRIRELGQIFNSLDPSPFKLVGERISGVEVEDIKIRTLPVGYPRWLSPVCGGSTKVFQDLGISAFPR